MPGRHFGGFLARCADRGDLELRQRPQGWDMGDRGESTVGAGSDDADADFAICHENLPGKTIRSHSSPC
jgi:hypothetical protein